MGKKCSLNTPEPIFFMGSDRAIIRVVSTLVKFRCACSPAAKKRPKSHSKSSEKSRVSERASNRIKKHHGCFTQSSRNQQNSRTSSDSKRRSTKIFKAKGESI